LINRQNLLAALPIATVLVAVGYAAGHAAGWHAATSSHTQPPVATAGGGGDEEADASALADSDVPSPAAASPDAAPSAAAANASQNDASIATATEITAPTQTLTVTGLTAGQVAAMMPPPPAVQAAAGSAASAAPAISGESAPQAAPAVPDGTLATAERVYEARLKRGGTLFNLLRDAGLSNSDTHAALKALGTVLDVRRVVAGTVVTGVTPAGEATSTRLRVRIDATRTIEAQRTADGTWKAAKHEALVIKKMAAYAGVVTSSLWNSATQAGMDPDLVTRMADVFAWQIDFSREVQRNDRWRLSVERLYVDGKAIGFGDITAAEYENVGVVRSAVRFSEEGFGPRYYTPTGQSLQRMFLKAPLKFGRITSGFTARRFHPVLKVNRPHHGVDYGAPVGTPVMSVGEGVVSFVGNRGASGKMVSVRHSGVYETHYKHLSAYAPGIKVGTKVTMGQVIGSVGMTGLATGPHLHFEFHVGGRYVDPQSIDFPAADPVPAAAMDKFLQASAAELKDLPPWSEIVLARDGRPRAVDTVNPDSGE
jgi:murein DD-endopeptidase MepM/ murein hydrolase activator NlpD